MGRWQLAVTLALALVLLGAAPGFASADLGSLLAQPPSSDWLEYSPAPDVLVGPFTASSYAAFVTHVNGTQSRAEADLNLLGFVSGYAGEWKQRGTGDYLLEVVFEFRTEMSAASWYGSFKLQDETYKTYQSDISGLDSIPNSYGAVLGYVNGNGREYRVDFHKANLMFVVHAGSATDDLTTMAVRQAQTEYDRAPASLTSSSSSGTKPAASNALLIVGAVVIAGVLLVSALIMILVIVTGPSRRRPAAAIPAGLQVSPDGRYWWDGLTWRPTGRGP